MNINRHYIIGKYYYAYELPEVIQVKLNEKANFTELEKYLCINENQFEADTIESTVYSLEN